MSKRTIFSFFQPSPSKKPRLDTTDEEQLPPSTHPSYPQSIASLPPSLLVFLQSHQPPSSKAITNKPDLNLLYYTPLLPTSISKPLYTHLRSSLPFYRVTYPIKRGTFETLIHTPRYTTVFGVDAFSAFTEDGELVDAVSGKKVDWRERYGKYRPRPVPQCLKVLKEKVEGWTGCKFNFVLVNYYADTTDSISYHSDDESFLGSNPTIASLSLGSTRDFLMKHKDKTHASQNLKFAFQSGEMLVMKGTTQGKWLHSIPKRSERAGEGGWHGGGRINITFRKAVEKAGTGNYFRYNVGDGPVFRWDEKRGKMVERENRKVEGKNEAQEEADGVEKKKETDDKAELLVEKRKHDMLKTMPKLTKEENKSEVANRA